MENLHTKDLGSDYGDTGVYKFLSGEVSQAQVRGCSKRIVQTTLRAGRYPK